MTDYREINAIAKNPARAKVITASLLAIPTLEWTDWEKDFLDHMMLRDEELSTRQAEKLVELRDDSKHYEKVDGFVLRTLVDKCFIYRCELSEHDAEFIERKKASDQGRFLRRDASRILRCARQAGEIDPHQGWSLERGQDH